MESVILEQSLVSVALNSEIARVCAKEALSLFIAYSLLIIVKDMLQNVDTGLGNGSRGSLNPKEQPAGRLGWKRTWIREKSKSGRTSPEKGKVEKKKSSDQARQNKCCNPLQVSSRLFRASVPNFQFRHDTVLRKEGSRWLVNLKRDQRSFNQAQISCGHGDGHTNYKVVNSPFHNANVHKEISDETWTVGLSE